jgi:acetyl-CoA carboxylase, biotin carboxylase subunit
VLECRADARLLPGRDQSASANKPVKILVANRGEIAIRIMRACREMGLATVAVYSECDRPAPHVRYADEAHGLGASPPGESYLRIDKLIDVARRAGVDAVHPGYGFLAENPAFARACGDAGLTFIGPAPDVMALMGSKTAARAAAIEAGVPVVPGTAEPVPPHLAAAEIELMAADLGYPLLVKAVAGGGGKGMRLVRRPEELSNAVRAARSEAGTAFGDAAVYLEKRLTRPRHVEIQILGDLHGTVVPFVERECSIQRRHQKVIEESPSAAIDRPVRERLAGAAAAIARRVGYTNAGTIEFLVEEDGRFYFLEMNTRLQVEHPITEVVTGVDLVHWQILIARGERLTLDPEAALQPGAHAIECRVYAEDPDNQFIPSPGPIRRLNTPSGPGVRDDSGVAAGFEVPIYYDSLLSKLIVWAEDRPRCLARLRRALGEYDIVGPRTTLPFFRWIVDQADFSAGRFDTTTLDRWLDERNGQPFSASAGDAEAVAAIGVALHAVTAIPGPARAGHSRAATTQAGAAMNPGGWKRQARLEGLRR